MVICFGDLGGRVPEWLFWVGCLVGLGFGFMVRELRVSESLEG